MHRRLLFVLILFFTHTSFASQIFKGPKKSVGSGEAYTWVRTNQWDEPKAIGITMSASALENLPDGHMPTEFILKLPRQFDVPPYDHVGLDWNPMGHIPDHVYDVPHFDLHFYLMSQGKRSKISCAGEDLARCERAPKNKYVPEFYMATPGGVPTMGAHWIDPRSEEFNGMPFTATMIFGFYNGRLNFIEPMFTKAFLESKPNLVREIPQPKSYRLAGYYPREYRITYNSAADTYTVSLAKLRYR